MVAIGITLGLLLLLLFSGLPVAIAMLGAGIGGLLFWGGPDSLIVSAKVLADSLDNYVLLAIPLFVLMGGILSSGRLGDKIYSFCDVWFRRIPGGVGIATILACGVVSAMSGTNTALVAAVGPMALPGLQKSGFNLKETEGLLAGAGCLGTLIPPSASMIVFGALAHQNVAKLFMAGVIPGVIMMVMFMAYCSIKFWMSHRSDLTKWTQNVTWKERWLTTRDSFLVLLLVPAIMVPLYLGIVTPTEQAVLGSIFAFILVLGIYRSASLKEMAKMLRTTFSIAVMVCLLLAGGLVFGAAIINMGLPSILSKLFMSAGIPAWGFMAIAIIVKIIMGLVITGAPMGLILLPILLPALLAYNIDLIWYSVIFTMLGELGGITPPVGITVFVTHGISKSMGYPSKIADTYRGSVPYMILLVICLAIVLAFPSLSTWIPSLM